MWRVEGAAGKGTTAVLHSPNPTKHYFLPSKHTFLSSKSCIKRILENSYILWYGVNKHTKRYPPPQKFKKVKASSTKDNGFKKCSRPNWYYFSNYIANMCPSRVRTMCMHVCDRKVAETYKMREVVNGRKTCKLSEISVLACMLWQSYFYLLWCGNFMNEASQWLDY